MSLLVLLRRALSPLFAGNSTRATASVVIGPAVYTAFVSFEP